MWRKNNHNGCSWTVAHNNTKHKASSPIAPTPAASHSESQSCWASLAFASDTESKCSFASSSVPKQHMARRQREGEVAYTVEFWEGVDADVDPLLVDARRGLRGWHGSVFHRRRRWDSHGADGAACKHEQRVIVFVRFASLLILRTLPAQRPLSCLV